MNSPISLRCRIGTTIFDKCNICDNGNNVVCTVIETGPCVVTQIKTEDTDGYRAVQMGFGDKTEKSTTYVPVRCALSKVRMRKQPMHRLFTNKHVAVCTGTAMLTGPAKVPPTLKRAAINRRLK